MFPSDGGLRSCGLTSPFKFLCPSSGICCCTKLFKREGQQNIFLFTDRLQTLVGYSRSSDCNMSAQDLQIWRQSRLRSLDACTVSSRACSTSCIASRRSVADATDVELVVLALSQVCLQIALDKQQAKPLQYPGTLQESWPRSTSQTQKIFCKIYWEGLQLRF